MLIVFLILCICLHLLLLGTYRILHLDLFDNGLPVGQERQDLLEGKRLSIYVIFAHRHRDVVDEVLHAGNGLDHLFELADRFEHRVRVTVR